MIHYISEEQNKIDTQIGQIKDNIMQKNSTINDGPDYTLMKDKEISNQNIVQKMRH